MTEKDIRIMSAPPEQWEATKHYESTNAYTETHKDRNKQNAAFGAKEYRFDEEVCNNA